MSVCSFIQRCGFPPRSVWNFQNQALVYTQVGIHPTAFFTFKQQYSIILLMKHPFITAPLQALKNVVYHSVPSRDFTACSCLHHLAVEKAWLPGRLGWSRQGGGHCRSGGEEGGRRGSSREELRAPGGSDSSKEEAVSCCTTAGSLGCPSCRTNMSNGF